MLAISWRKTRLSPKTLFPSFLVVEKLGKIKKKILFSCFRVLRFSGALIVWCSDTLVSGGHGTLFFVSSVGLVLFFWLL